MSLQIRHLHEKFAKRDRVIPQEVDGSPARYAVAVYDLAHNDQAERMSSFEIISKRDILEHFGSCRSLDSMNSLLSRRLSYLKNISCMMLNILVLICSVYTNLSVFQYFFSNKQRKAN